MREVNRRKFIPNSMDWSKRSHKKIFSCFGKAHQWEMVFTLLAAHLEEILIVRGPKLPKTGSRSTDDPLTVYTQHNYLVFDKKKELIYQVFLDFQDNFSRFSIISKISKKVKENTLSRTENKPLNNGRNGANCAR